MTTHQDPILPINRTKAQAASAYDRLSPYYDTFAGVFEQPFKNKTLKQLNISTGDTVLEIGVGTGRSLQQIACSVGETGKACGIDISAGMISITRQRLEKSNLSHRVELTCQDASRLPYAPGTFDAVFMSFTLELFDTPDIPRLLAEIDRVLRPGGRIGVISLSKGSHSSIIVKIYEWLHMKFPQVFDCRPIYLVQSIYNAGFDIQHSEFLSIIGLPGEIVIAMKQYP